MNKQNCFTLKALNEIKDAVVEGRWDVPLTRIQDKTKNHVRNQTQSITTKIMFFFLKKTLNNVKLAQHRN